MCEPCCKSDRFTELADIGNLDAIDAWCRQLGELRIQRSRRSYLSEDRAAGTLRDAESDSK
jgi:hypothetical protein